MTYQIIFILSVLGISLIYADWKKRKRKTEFKPNQLKTVIEKEQLTFFEDDNLPYVEKLDRTKKLYPFENWRNNFIEYEMEQYSEGNCNAAKNIFDTLINKLNKLGENGNKQEKEKCFEVAVISLNELNDKDDSLIETGEREDLCELIDQITIAAGLNPKEYADGEGIADLWREW